MRVTRSVILATLILAGLSFSHSEVRAQGQGEKIKFTTSDGAIIKGTFYAKNKAPVVMLLHAVGGEDHSRKKVWVSLAEELNKNYAVLAFDFRGHGESTDVEPEEFWKHNINKSLVKGAPKGQSISFQGMKPAYFPVMINDIAAARAFLENRNDVGDCNIGSLILIGAETGATLGSIWLSSEWVRYQITPAMFGPGILNKHSEGKDIIAAIWLTPTIKLGPRDVKLAQVLEFPGKTHKTPMVFFYGDGDDPGKKAAKLCEKSIKGAKPDAAYRFTAAVGLPETKLTGSDLLQKALKTNAAIVDYLDEVVQAKGNAYDGKRDFRKTNYVWVLNNLRVAAKHGNERILVFDTYEKFIPK